MIDCRCKTCTGRRQMSFFEMVCHDVAEYMSPSFRSDMRWWGLNEIRQLNTKEPE